MRIAKLIAKESIILDQSTDKLTPGMGEAVVKVKTVGICGTDMHVFRGERADVHLPLVMGHELSGVVVQTGAGVENIKEGMRVVFDPVMACGVCKVCKNGYPNVCDQVKCYGVQMDGGFRDEICVPAVQLYEIPDHVSFDQAALTEPFSIAANILDRAGLKAGEKLVVIGTGTVGLCVIQAAKGMGAQVLAADIVESKLALAKEFGCDEIVNTKRTSLADAVRQWAKEGADVLLDAVGTSPLTQQLIDLAAPTARIVVIGFDDRPVVIPSVLITKKQLSIIGSRMNAGKFPQVIEWLENGSIHPEKMISHIYPIEDIQQAFEEVCSNPQLLKVLIRFDD